MYNQYEADLADMQKLKDKNERVQFLLVVIDVLPDTFGWDLYKPEWKKML